MLSLLSATVLCTLWRPMGYYMAFIHTSLWPTERQCPVHPLAPDVLSSDLPSLIIIISGKQCTAQANSACLLLQVLFNAVDRPVTAARGLGQGNAPRMRVATAGKNTQACRERREQLCFQAMLTTNWSSGAACTQSAAPFRGLPDTYLGTKRVVQAVLPL